MNNQRYLVSHNKREGWYFGFYNKHLRAYQIDSLASRVKMFKQLQKIKRFYE